MSFALSMSELGTKGEVQQRTFQLSFPSSNIYARHTWKLKYFTMNGAFFIQGSSAFMCFSSIVKIKLWSRERRCQFSQRLVKRCETCDGSWLWVCASNGINWLKYPRLERNHHKALEMTSHLLKLKAKATESDDSSPRSCTLPIISRASRSPRLFNFLFIPRNVVSSSLLNLSVIVRARLMMRLFRDWNWFRFVVLFSFSPHRPEHLEAF